MIVFVCRFFLCVTYNTQVCDIIWLNKSFVSRKNLIFSIYLNCLLLFNKLSHNYRPIFGIIPLSLFILILMQQRLTCFSGVFLMSLLLELKVQTIKTDKILLQNHEFRRKFQKNWSQVCFMCWQALSNNTRFKTSVLWLKSYLNL